MYFHFYIDTPTTAIYTLSLHDALPISFPATRTARVPSGGCYVETGTSHCGHGPRGRRRKPWQMPPRDVARATRDRKSTRLNSSHPSISYAVFCLKKKMNTNLDH